MVRLISKEFALDASGKPVKIGVYLADAGDTLPSGAAVGSRALYSDGAQWLKTPSGWQRRGASNDPI